MNAIDKEIIGAVINSGYGIEIGTIIAAQARHETANYTSKLCRNSNNFFGMKVPTKRKSPYIIGASILSTPPRNEGKTPYASYNSAGDSAKDLIHWLEYSKTDFSAIKTPKAYAAMLKRKGYYGAPQSEYEKSLISKMKKIGIKPLAKGEQNFNFVPLMLALVGLITLGVIFLKPKK